MSALLSSRGYREVRRFELRRVDFAGEPPPPRDVEGISVRGFRPEEARQLYEAHVEAFADHWGESEETYEVFRHRHLDAPEFDPALWFVAWDGDELAGYVGAHEKSREDASRGYIALLAVRRAYRRRGLGEALLLRASEPFMRAAGGEPTCTSTPIRSPARRGLRKGRHDRPPSLCDLGERAPAHPRPLVHRPPPPTQPSGRELHVNFTRFERPSAAVDIWPMHRRLAHVSGDRLALSRPRGTRRADP